MRFRGTSSRLPEGRRPLRVLSAAALMVASVAVLVLAPARLAGAEPKAPAPHLSGAPLTHHDAPGFPGTSTTAPFNECPQIGYDASCGLLINVSNNGENVLQDPNNAASGVSNINPGNPQPYDNIEDTLIGIVNNSSKPIFSLQLSASAAQVPIFGFDGDGICTYANGGSNTAAVGGGGGGQVGGPGEPPAGYTGSGYCNASQLAGGAGPSGPDPNGSDYQGPTTSYSNISSDTTSGVVNFNGGLAPGQSTYFSLEDSLTSSQVTVTFGYWLAASDGGIFAYDAPFFGSMGGQHLNGPIVGIAADPRTGGYWLVAKDGGLFAFNAPFFGSMGGQPLNAPIVGMVATPDGLGYWEVAQDGGIFSFGDAAFHGSMGGVHLNKPVVGIATSPDGGGYWEVAGDGGIFAFGDAMFHGSMGGVPLNQPVVGITGDQGTGGYWEVAADGGLFAFDAPFYGSTGGMPLNKPVVGMASTPDGQGYWEVASDGGIFNYGDAFFWGSTGAITLNAPVVGIAGSNA